LNDLEGYPLINLEMTCQESPNIITLRRFLVTNKCRSCRSANHSTSLLVLVPRPQVKVCSTSSTPTCVQGDIDVVNGSKGYRKAMYLELTHSIRYGMQLDFSSLYIIFELAQER